MHGTIRQVTSGTQAPGAPARPAGPLCAAAAMLCERLLPQVSARTAAGLGVVLHRLTAPLQVAVAGRLKSGKSTLVNALIGRRVAPTAVGECTRLVTRFRYGTVDRVEVVRTDGQRQVLPFQSDGGIPSDIGHLVGGIDRVSHLDAYLTSDLLRELTVIDTPGLGSLDAASVSRTEAVLGSAGGGLDPVSTSAVAGAEAVVYVVTQSVRSDDRQALAAFLAATARRDAGPVNAIGVLNKADTAAPSERDEMALATVASLQLLNHLFVDNFKLPTQGEPHHVQERATAAH